MADGPGTMIGRPACAEQRPFIIAHLSDLHCGSPYFVANLLERAIMEINELEPDVVVCSGDLTTFGYKQEYAPGPRAISTGWTAPT